MNALPLAPGYRVRGDDTFWFHLSETRFGGRIPILSIQILSWPAEERATQTRPLGAYIQRADARWLGGLPRFNRGTSGAMTIFGDLILKT